MNDLEEHGFIREVFRRAMPDDLPAAIEQRLEKRLTTFRERFDTGSAVPGSSRIRRLLRLGAVDRTVASRPLEPVSLCNRMTQWMGGLTMRKRIALGSVGAAALLGLLVLWGAIVAKPVSALEKMAENIRQAKSLKYKMIVQITQDLPGPETQRVSKSYGHVIYRLASGTWRNDSWDSPECNGPPEETEIHLIGKPGILFNHRDKKFRRREAGQLQANRSGIDQLESLGKFSGEADRELGMKEINGLKARGFQIDMKKIDEYSGLAEVWLDTKSNLPVLVRYDIERPRGRSWTDLISDIQWNIDLDPKLFDPTPPEGYADVTPQKP